MLIYNALTWFLCFVSVAMFSACIKNASSDTELVLPMDPNNFRYDDLSAFDMHLETEWKRPVKEIKTTTKKDSKCLKFYQDFVLPRKLEFSLDQTSSHPSVSTIFQELNQFSPSYCDHPESKILMAESLKNLLTNHHDQILILMGAGSTEKDLSSIQKSIEIVSKSNTSYKDIHILNLGTNIGKNEQIILESISKRLPSMFILFGKELDLTIPLEISKKYLIPSIVLSPQENSHKNYPYAFRVYPSQENMSKSLVDYLATKGIHRIAMLRSIQSERSKFLTALGEYAKTKNIELVSTEVFDRNQSLTMQKASENLFKTDPNLRPDEYAALVEEKQRSQADILSDVELNKIKLKPMIEFDAIVISDHFRIARFFSSQFKFLGTPKITLIGNHEWRDPGLVDPPDHQLNGSLFVDFIGRKSSFPESLQDLVDEEHGFLFSKDSNINIDTLILSYVALWTSNEAVNTNSTKQHILRDLKALKANFPGFIQQRVFDSNRTINWPSYIFSIAGKDIVEVAQYNAPIQAPTATK